MAECRNCGAFVTDDYQRVLGVEGEVIACPHCPDKIQDGVETREARSNRRVEQ